MLTKEHRQRLDTLLNELAPNEQLWLSGYVAGFVGQQQTGQTEQTRDDTHRCTVVYASQSGNAKNIAERLCDSAGESGIDTQLVDIATLPVAKLKRLKQAVFVVSTYGEGDPPDTALKFFHDIAKDSRSDLHELQYAVCALGDSSYEHFCATGKQLDAWLQARGATSMQARLECDIDFDIQVNHWITQIVDQWKEHQQPRQLNGLNGAHTNQLASRPLTATVPMPFTVLENKLLTDSRGGRDIFHLTLGIDGALTYHPGDVLVVTPQLPDHMLTALTEAFVAYGWRCNDERLRQVICDRDIQHLTQADITAYLTLAGITDVVPPSVGSRTLMDILAQWPAKTHDEDALYQWLATLPVLRPREYSIASSPLLSDDSVDLTISRVQALSPFVYGVCSNYLFAQREEAVVQAYVKPNTRFRLPTDDTPIIMIGAGTGIAPYRAFLQTREATDARGHNWLLFGVRTRRFDFLYQTELLHWLDRGVLHRLDMAFSRDGTEKVYVQHLITRHAKAFYAAIADGATIYVCGDAEGMAPAVHQAITAVIAEQRGVDGDAAQAYVTDLLAEGRYLRDVY